jgi:hypothetical protein
LLTCIQLGGSRGHVSFEILSKHPKLKAIVQDLPELQSEWNPPAELAGRVSFQVHDFFTEEPVRNADVYFMRRILHDWSDKYAVKVLQNIVPAMGPKSRILICELVLPPPGVVPVSAERMMVALDMQMLVALPALERSSELWARLLAKADKRLKIKEIHGAPGGPSSIVEVVLE